MNFDQALTTEPVVFDTAGELDLKMDLIRPKNGSASYAVWIHGGALLGGSRHSVPAWLGEACIQNGIGLASIDYRLAPTTKLPKIVGDVERAIRWVVESADAEGSEFCLAVVGESAGGYLAMTAGFRAAVVPKAVISLWGYGDLIDDWYTKPSPHAVHHEIEVPEATARGQVAGPDVVDGRHRPGDVRWFYQFCRQHGIWPFEVSGWDPVKEYHRFTEYMPINNVSPSYPPTLLVHGTEDDDVPFTESLKMAALFDQNGVEHELVDVVGAGHALRRAARAELSRVHDRASRFLVDHLEQGRSRL